MNLKGLLPQDAELLEGYVERIVDETGIDDRGAMLVRCSLGRIAAHQIREQYPKLMSDGWESALPAWRDEIHIMDWIVTSIIDAAPWLSNVDGQGRPKKLMKCSGYEDLVREADRYFAKQRGQLAKALGPEDEEYVADLGGGYKLVRLLTPKALDLESFRQHHCIGHGSYDERLATNWYRYLSVRDPKRRPAATIELRQEPNGRWAMNQCQGKRNARPDRAIMDVLKLYSAQQKWLEREYWWHTVVDVRDREHDVDRIPAGVTIVGDLNVGGDVVDMLAVFELPPGLTVLGNVVISPKLRIPEGLTVSGSLEIERHPIMLDGDFEGVVLPESLHVDKEIRFFSGGDIARPIPTHLYPRVKVYQDRGAMLGQQILHSLEASEALDDEGPSNRDAVMTEVAIQICKAGISWAFLPEPLSMDGENVVEGHAHAWPQLVDYLGALLPFDMCERLQTYVLVAEIAEPADFVLFAVEEGADLRRVGIAEVALEALGCVVTMRDAHPGGAEAIMRAHIAETVENSPRPPGP